MKIFLRMIALLALVSSANAWANLDSGENIPESFTAKDHMGESRDFAAIAGERGAVLVFVRSADWCPYCQSQLIMMNKAQSQFEALGYSVVSVSYDSVETLNDFAEKHDISYTLLSDDGSKLIRDFGILNEEMKEGTRFYGIPHPTIYVVNAQGIIEAHLAEEGYKDRPAVEDIISAIESANKATP